MDLQTVCLKCLKPISFLNITDQKTLEIDSIFGCDFPRGFLNKDEFRTLSNTSGQRFLTKIANSF